MLHLTGVRMSQIQCLTLCSLHIRKLADWSYSNCCLPMLGAASHGFDEYLHSVPWRSTRRGSLSQTCFTESAQASIPISNRHTYCLVCRVQQSSAYTNDGVLLDPHQNQRAIGTLTRFSMAPTELMDRSFSLLQGPHMIFRVRFDLMAHRIRLRSSLPYFFLPPSVSRTSLILFRS